MSKPKFSGHCSPSLAAATDQVQIVKTITNGFVHPGIGLTKEILENARTQVLANKEPWLSGFRALASNRDSSRNVSCRNQSRKDPSKPEADAFDNRGINDRLIGDSFKAYRQVLMYYFTGDEVYRANAMKIVRVWSQMDRAKYKRWPEDHIHSSYPIQRMIMAAELLRYTSFRDPKLAWTEQDTDNFTKNFVVPAVSTFLDHNGLFMNQNGYPIAAAMSGDIFTSDRKSYGRHVEWFTVNKDAPNKGWSFSIKDLARLVTTNALTGEQVGRPQVQLMEMGRDQAHAGDDMEIFNNVVRIMHTQGTKVDPVTGVISTADIAFVRVKGSPDAIVEISQLLRKPDAQMTAPAFAAGNEPLRLVAYRGAPITIDFSATKQGSTESIRYESSDEPNDSKLDPKTGAFFWKPETEGEHSFIVTALAGETLGVKKVTIIVAPDRSGALKLATIGYDSNAKYVKASLDRYQSAYAKTVGEIETASDSEFFAQLVSLQQAVQLLEPLTPLLKDGSMDFPKVVASSNIGESIGLLVDGNDDTFPVYLLAKDLNYVFDFGPKFKFSARDFAMEGRLNFEGRVANTKFFGSNDGKNWTELTPKAIGLATELSRVEVAPDLTHSTFRFLRIQKQGGTLFEPSELRIYGERHET